MTSLKNWVDSEHGRQKKLSDHLGVSTTFTHGFVNGKRPIPLHHMVAIEQFTNGEVTRKDMCPEWQRIWPELAGCNKEGCEFHV